MEKRDKIKELFDGIRAPESLSEENMLKMLKKHEAESGNKASAGASAHASDTEKAVENAAPEKQEWKETKPGKPALKKFLTAAAAVMIAAAGTSGLFAMYNKAPDTSANGMELYSFKSEREIRNTVRSLDAGRQGRLFSIGSSEISGDYTLEGDTDVMDAETADSVGSSASDAKTLSANSAAGTSADAGSHSETYLQVDDVDEADIVKTDGRYIYFVNSKKEVVILSAKNGRTKKLSTIGSTGVENYVNDIYLKGDKLVTVGSYYEDDEEEERSGVVVYDISDRSDPQMISVFSQSGSVITSRMVGDCVYLVTNDYVSSDGRYIPKCGFRGEYEDIPVTDISCVPDPRTSSYIVLSAVDISSGSQGRAAAKAVFGSTDDVYCNDHALYTASWEWSDKSNSPLTRIVRAKLDGLKVRFDATTSVKGYIDNQFSMDESGGYFRIATTSERAGMDVNNLYVLDKDLRESGKVTGFARNESIMAVRFIGSKAYVITYEAIDPLFIIDLADPENPRIEGEVKIDGFSTLLIPAGEGKLIGIGHATGDNGYGGEYDSGLKLALFDISDPSEPKVADSMEVEDMSSPAQSDHHALTVNSEEGWFAIPYDIWHYAETGEAMMNEDSVTDDAEKADETSTDEPVQESADEDYSEEGILIFKADNKIGPVDKHRLKESSICRSVYIDDYIYAIGRDGDVQSFRPEI